MTTTRAYRPFVSRSCFAALMTAFVASGLTAAPVQAELRTGYGDRVANGSDTERPSVPALRSLRVGHDTSAATLTFEVTFEEPVVDPSTTSALRSTELEVRVGDAYGPPAACTADKYELSTVIVPLGVDTTAPSLGLVPDNPDFPREKAGAEPITGARSWNADRTVLTLSFADARLTELTRICAGASTNLKSSAEGSYLRSFMLDGFTPYDGQSDATLYGLMTFDSLTPRTRCRLTSPPDTWNCPSVTLNFFSSSAARGGQVRLSGTYGFETRGSARYPSFRAFGRMTGSVSWRRCPRALRVKRNGRSCRIPLTWTGGDAAATVKRAIARRTR